MTRGPAVGIDLGTTNTVVAVQTDDTGPRLLDLPQPVDERRLLQSVDHVKSIVYLESPISAVVGAFAAPRWDAYRSIKSKIGTRWAPPHPHETGSAMDAAYLSAHVLKVAEQELKRQFSEWDGAAVITVPASFNTDQRRDTLRAARLAGFSSVRLLDEPTAAFYYHFDQARADTHQPSAQTVLVFDFGGGTLDVSIIRVARRGGAITIDPIGRSRYNNLGGDDIDLELASFLFGVWERRERLSLSTASDSMRHRVCSLFVTKASAYKEEVEGFISEGLEPNEFFIDDQVSEGGVSVPVRLSCLLTRSQYDEVTGRFFDPKSEINIFKPIEQAIDVAQQIDAAFARKSIDLVLFTGGASRMAAVRAALTAHFAPQPVYSISDEEACQTVALGAAACRYDQLFRGRTVQMTTRLLESILTRSEDGSHYVPLVPVTCEPAPTFTRVPREFHTQRRVLTLRVPLFRGTSVSDHQMSPMHDLELPLNAIVDSGVPYTLEYRMSTDKTIEFRARLGSHGGEVEATGQVDLHGGKSMMVRARTLCSVNSLR